MDKPDQLVHLELAETLVYLAFQVKLDQQEVQVLQVLLETRVLQGRKVNQDRQEIMVRMVQRVQQGLKDHRDLKDHKARMVNQDK